MSAVIGGFGMQEAGRRLHLNEHPAELDPAIAAALASEFDSLYRYPDPDSSELTAVIADRYGVAQEQVLVANGIDELMLMTPLALLRRGDLAVTCAQTFAGHRAAPRLVGAEVVEVPLDDLHVSLDALLPYADRARLIYVCNPHNPAGTMLAFDELATFAAAVAERGALVVVDEAYAEFAQPDPRLVDAVADGARLLVMRTFSKAWGLGGLRLGWAIGPPDVIGQIRAAAEVVPFSVNRLAQAAGLAALHIGDEGLARSRAVVAQAKERLYERLEALDLSYVRSQTNFVLVHTGTDSERLVREARDASGVMLRDLGPLFGIPGAIRITCPTPEDADCAADALAAALAPHRSPREPAHEERQP